MNADTYNLFNALQKDDFFIKDVLLIVDKNNDSLLSTYRINNYCKANKILISKKVNWYKLTAECIKYRFHLKNVCNDDIPWVNSATKQAYNLIKNELDNYANDISSNKVTFINAARIRTLLVKEYAYSKNIDLNQLTYVFYACHKQNNEYKVIQVIFNKHSKRYKYKAPVGALVKIGDRIKVPAGENNEIKEVKVVAISLTEKVPEHYKWIAMLNSNKIQQQLEEDFNNLKETNMNYDKTKYEKHHFYNGSDLDDRDDSEIIDIMVDLDDAINRTKELAKRLESKKLEKQAINMEKDLEKLKKYFEAR